MILSLTKYQFLARMRRPYGIAPKVSIDHTKRLGMSPQRVFELSLSLSLVLAIVGFRYFPMELSKKKIVQQAKEMVAVEDIVQTRQENRPPPPPRPAIPIEAPGAEALADVPIQSSELDVAEEVPPPPPNNDFGDDDESRYFVVVEEIPQLVGGIEGLMSRVVYPDIALRAGIQGKVMLFAFVNESGDVVRAEVIKGIGGGCDEAAVQALMKSKFSPGKQRGKPVKVKISLMVRFEIKGNASLP